MKNLMKPFWGTLLLVLSAPIALAEETTVDQAVGAANTSWIMTATALVLFMTLPGLALFYGGLVHKKKMSFLYSCTALRWHAY
jgi:Amt family ammonium transporter